MGRHLWMGGEDGAYQVGVIGQRQVRVKAALHEHGRASHFGGPPDLLDDLVGGVGVSALLGAGPRGPIKRAERAVGVADVGVVEVRVDYVSDHRIGVPRKAGLCGQLAQLQQVGALQKIETVGAIQPFVGDEFGADGIDHRETLRVRTRASNSKNCSRPTRSRSPRR